ncbi:MAG TPA: lysoplasmalogenase [Chitinophagaceae bacterium]|nr:lysoplasmalogenase [Chitinophagaceae bacterium]
MKKQNWIAFFIVILVIHLVSIVSNVQLAEYVSKPMIVALLCLYFLSQTNKVISGIKKWVIAALIFSWIGDVLLLFQPDASIFFLLGLSAFLIAHFFYIIFFHQVRIKENIKGNPWLLLIVVAYYAALIVFLSPYLGEMKLPVRIYGIVISFMFMLAMHTLFIKNKMAGRYMVTGALLFVISDSILAINKFYQAYNVAGVLIMFTYGLAQLFIVEGAIQYIRWRNELIK